MSDDVSPEASEGAAVHLGGRVDASIVERNPALADTDLLEGAVGKLETLAESMERDGPFLAVAAHEDLEAEVATEEAEPIIDVTDIDAAMFLHDPEADPDGEVERHLTDGHALSGEGNREARPSDEKDENAADDHSRNRASDLNLDEDARRSDLSYDGEPDEVHLLRISEEEFAASTPHDSDAEMSDASTEREGEEDSGTASSAGQQASEGNRTAVARSTGANDGSANEDPVGSSRTNDGDDDGNSGSPQPAPIASMDDAVLVPGGAHDPDHEETQGQADEGDAGKLRRSDMALSAVGQGSSSQDVGEGQRLEDERGGATDSIGEHMMDPRDEEQLSAQSAPPNMEEEGSAVEALFGPKAAPGSTESGGSDPSSDADPVDGGAATALSDPGEESGQARTCATPDAFRHDEVPAEASMEAAEAEGEERPADANRGPSGEPAQARFPQDGVEGRASESIEEEPEVTPHRASTKAWRRRVWLRVAAMNFLGATIILGALVLTWAVSTGRVAPDKFLARTLGGVEGLLGSAEGTETPMAAETADAGVKTAETASDAVSDPERPVVVVNASSAAAPVGNVTTEPVAETSPAQPEAGSGTLPVETTTQPGSSLTEEGSVDTGLHDPVAELAAQIEERLNPAPLVPDPVDVRRVIVIEEDIAAINARLDGVGAVLEKDQAGRAAFEGRLSLLSGRLDRMDTSLAAVSGALAQYAGLQSELEKVRTVLLDLAERMAEVEARNPADREETGAAIKELRLDLDRLVTNTAVIARMLSAGTVIDPSNELFAPGGVTSFSPPRRDLPGAGFDPVPDDVREGDYVEGWGYVLDVVPAENGQTLVILENGSVFK
ncbi:MAG: hypothetical protein F4213_08500 [Boseongicola sp. SB0677_bin_26]|nr:hypothetical protein [Boseongicola sp. SB0665_bin_10]MYG26051.1 hypothetical protein [Boseongicola sp. SB0677_bin_26]